MKYSFETCWNDQWMRSSVRFDDFKTAAQAMAQWVTVCAENGVFPDVRLCKTVDQAPHPKGDINA